MGAGISQRILDRNLHIVMLGLDNSGKTTVLYRLKFDEHINTVPTIGFNAEKVKFTQGKAKGSTFMIWDVGGQDKLRPLWKAYTRNANGIIFVVDSCDTERVEEVKSELHNLAKNLELQGVPILVLANKQDLPRALSAAELESRLNLHQLASSMHPWHIQPTCAIIGDGLSNGIDVLYEMMTTRKKKKGHRPKKKRR